MIVQCEHCQTKYRIADEKVKGKGVKVRCAKCENVFTVTPSEAEIPAPAAPTPPLEPAAPAPSEPARSTPEPSASDPQPTPPPSVPDSREQAVPSQNGGVLEDPASAMPEPPPEQDPVPEPPEAPPGLPPLPPLDSSLDPPAPDVEQQATDAASSEQEPFGQELPSSDGEPQDPAAQRPAHEMDQTGLISPPADPADRTEDGDFELESTLRDDTPTGSDPFGGEDNTGLPPLMGDADQDGEWGNIPIEGQKTPGAPEGDFGLAGESGYVPPPPVPVEEPFDHMLHDHMSDPLPEDISTVPTYQPETRSSGGGKKVLVAVFLLAILGGGGYFAYPTVMEKIQARNQQAEGTLTPAEIKVKVLNRTDGKIIYSVRGEVRNESSSNVGLIQVEAQFRNASGDVLGKAISYCGNLIPDSDLVKLDLNQIRSDLQNELGQSLSNTNIIPGQAVPFLVVMDNPPSGISKVTVTISSFKETT